jgi:hypothetical protein
MFCGEDVARVVGGKWLAFVKKQHPDLKRQSDHARRPRPAAQRFPRNSSWRVSFQGKVIGWVD